MYHEDVMLIFKLYLVLIAFTHSIVMIYQTNLFAFNHMMIVRLINGTIVKMHSCLAKIMPFKRIQLCSKLDGISGKMLTVLVKNYWRK